MRAVSLHSVYRVAFLLLRGTGRVVSVTDYRHRLPFPEVPQHTPSFPEVRIVVSQYLIQKPSSAEKREV
jgi:hypothetical protein